MHMRGIHIPQYGLRSSAFREPATPAESAALAEFQETAAVGALGTETKVVLAAALGAVGR